MLKPQDLVILTQLCLMQTNKWTYAQLADLLCRSASETHAGVKQAEISRLYNPYEQSVNRRAFKELLRGGVPLCELIAQEGLPPVWPWAEGKDIGYAFEPLYGSVPEASQKNASLYECLTLIDALRV